jgi:hypothetical protein
MASLSDIVHRLGGNLQAGGSRALVPGPGHSKCDRSLSLLLAGDHIIYHSFAGDPDDAVRAHLGLANIQPASAVERRRAQQERESQQRAARERSWRFCERVWGAAQPIAATPAERYLNGRAITLAALDLRYQPNAPCSYDSRKTCAALVALVRAPDGAPTAIQSTFIKQNGRGKAFSGSSRLTFGPLAAGAVRLVAPRDGVLAVAEGVETALSFTQLFDIPCWAALGTSNLAAFEPPAGLRKLWIAGDPGEAGIEAARQLAKRLCDRMEVAISRPNDGPGDWNDALKRRAK